MGSSQSAFSSTPPANAHDAARPPSGCPMHNALDPSNNIPVDLAQTPVSPLQTHALPLERSRSSIPRSSSSSSLNAETRGGASSCPVAHEGRGGDGETWVYPSPQQFYNALVRKGWETPEESVPMMVDIHNWMNEAAWNEVLRWELTYFQPPPPPPPPQHTTAVSSATPDVSLMKFTGLPSTLSPKARYHVWLGWLFPWKFSDQKPFDRHDWMIKRDAWGPQESDKLHRYVIDYYSAPDDEQGNPVFHLDVRPALDDFGAVKARLTEWAKVKSQAWSQHAEESGNGFTAATQRGT